MSALVPILTLLLCLASGVNAYIAMRARRAAWAAVEELRKPPPAERHPRLTSERPHLDDLPSSPPGEEP